MFLKDLEQRARAYAASVPVVDDFVREFLSGWVIANTEQRRSALRSPLSTATVADGYISVDLRLDYHIGSFYVGYQNEARLHCPGSEQVARELTRTRGSTNFDQLGIPIHLRISASDDAWEKLPPLAKRARIRELRFDSGRQLSNSGMRTYWQWLTSASRRTSLSELFQTIQTLKG